MGLVTGWQLFRTLEKEAENFTKLNEKALGVKITAHEGDKREIAAIFERINQAREQLVVHTGVIVIIFCLDTLPICLVGDWASSSPDCSCN